MYVMSESLVVCSSERLQSPHGTASVHLDALRGIAAIGVCLSHLRDVFFLDYPHVSHHTALMAILYLATGLGHQWVMVFFVLSGYLVGGSVLRAHAARRWKWRTYLFQRLTRLYIVLVPALVLGGLIDVIGLHVFGTHDIYGGAMGNHTITFAVKSHLGFATLLGNYAFLQTILVPTLGSNGPLWSLSNEFWYYIAFPALFFMLLPGVALRRRLLHLVLFVAVLLLVKPQIALLGFVWLMGVWIPYLPRIPAANTVLRRTLMFFALAVLAGTLAWCKVAHWRWSDYVLGVAVTFLIYIVRHCSAAHVSGLYARVARQISGSSYTLYLTHLPMLVLFAALFETRFHQGQWQPDARHALYGAGLFIFVMLYAQVVWFFFEKRTDGLRAALKSRFTPKPQAVAPVPDPPQ